MTSYLASAQSHTPNATIPKPQLVTNPSRESSSNSSKSKVHSLAALWARKYFSAVTKDYDAEQLRKNESLREVTSKEGRDYTAEKLLSNLSLGSARAWSLTETLLSKEVQRHGINPELLNPLQIAADTRHLFEKALAAYGERATPRRLSVVLGQDFGKVRQKYTSEDPRAIGFVSMQFHYTGQLLLEWLSPVEQALWKPYLKVMDDHMYMPLRAAYDAAGNHEYNSPAIKAVQHLLPVSTKIAHLVCDQICRLHPAHRTYSGSLSESVVKTASIRDAEMFQVYLCLCVLEDDIRSVQRELFPLCVMLYPRLGVSWKLVQDMLKIVGWEMFNTLTPEDMATFMPYLRTMTEMFSDEVFQGR
jgi:hypothetical protein